LLPPSLRYLSLFFGPFFLFFSALNRSNLLTSFCEVSLILARCRVPCPAVHMQETSSSFLLVSFLFGISLLALLEGYSSPLLSTMLRLEMKEVIFSPPFRSHFIGMPSFRFGGAFLSHQPGEETLALTSATLLFCGKVPWC